MYIRRISLRLYSGVEDELERVSRGKFEGGEVVFDVEARSVPFDRFVDAWVDVEDEAADCFDGGFAGMVEVGEEVGHVGDGFHSWK